MIDPITVFVVAFLAAIGVAALCFHRWYHATLSGLVAVAVLLGISYGSGWPTNVPFPDNAIIYGLTSKHVWAGTKEHPMPPRAYQFEAPPEWFEERDRRRGQPFGVERMEEAEQKPTGRPNRSDQMRDDTPGWRIIQNVLPPKD